MLRGEACRKLRCLRMHGHPWVAGVRGVGLAKPQGQVQTTVSREAAEGHAVDSEAICQIQRAGGRLGWPRRQGRAGWINEEWGMEEARNTGGSQPRLPALFLLCWWGLCW